MHTRVGTYGTWERTWEDWSLRYGRVYGMPTQECVDVFVACLVFYHVFTSSLAYQEQCLSVGLVVVYFVSDMVCFGIKQDLRLPLDQSRWGIRLWVSLGARTALELRRVKQSLNIIQYYEFVKPNVQQSKTLCFCKICK